MIRKNENHRSDTNVGNGFLKNELMLEWSNTENKTRARETYNTNQKIYYGDEHILFARD